jgi:hypothetical protein
MCWSGNKPSTVLTKRLCIPDVLCQLASSFGWLKFQGQDKLKCAGIYHCRSLEQILQQVHHCRARLAPLFNEFSKRLFHLIRRSSRISQGFAHGKHRVTEQGSQVQRYGIHRWRTKMRSEMIAQFTGNDRTHQRIFSLSTGDGNLTNPGVPGPDIWARIKDLHYLRFLVQLCLRKCFRGFFAKILHGWWFLLYAGKYLASCSHSEYSRCKTILIFSPLRVPFRSMMTCCIWVSMAWRIARRSSPFSFA